MNGQQLALSGQPSANPQTKSYRRLQNTLGPYNLGFLLGQLSGLRSQVSLCPDLTTTI